MLSPTHTENIIESEQRSLDKDFISCQRELLSSRSVGMVASQ